MTHALASLTAPLASLAGIVLLACSVLAMEPALAQKSPQASVAPAASTEGPSWSSLTPAQRASLAPLQRDWPSIEANRKQKWLDIAARMPSMPPEERQRIQDRMSEWARMTPEERGRARLQFQEARQISPQQRQARWDAYLALPEEERRALAKSATKVPQVSKPSPAEATPQAVAPTPIQAKPGASTTLISRTASPPPHVQPGQPKIAAGQGAVNRNTLLPKSAPPSEAAASSTAP